MDIRHLVIRTPDSVDYSKSVLFNGAPIIVNVNKTSTHDVQVVDLTKTSSDTVSLSADIAKGKQMILESPFAEVLCKDDELLPISRLFGFSVQSNGVLSDFLPVGASFEMILENDGFRDFLCKVSKNMFPLVNPVTREPDVLNGSFFQPYIPLSILTGTMTPQTEKGDVFFNPNGTVSVAEFLDSLNAIKFGCNSNRSRKKTLDNISDEDDYFNEGYQSCIRGISGYFFNLYTRKELLKPITRIELAYITVLCWQRFLERFNNVFCTSYYLGVNFDWENPKEELSKYADGTDYVVAKVILDEEHDVVSLDVKDYKVNESMSDMLDDMKNGIRAIPVPMFMSLIELGVLNLFHFEDNRLDPLRQVSRGELCYFITMLAKVFPMNYL